MTIITIDCNCNFRNTSWERILFQQCSHGSSWKAPVVKVIYLTFVFVTGATIVVTIRQQRRRPSLGSREDATTGWRWTMWSARNDNAAPSDARNLAVLSKEHRLFRGYRTVTATAVVVMAEMMTVMMRFSRSLVSPASVNTYVRVLRTSTLLLFYCVTRSERLGGHCYASPSKSNRTSWRRFRYSYDSLMVLAIRRDEDNLTRCLNENSEQSSGGGGERVQE